MGGDLSGTDFPYAVLSIEVVMDPSRVLSLGVDRLRLPMLLLATVLVAPSFICAQNQPQQPAPPPTGGAAPDAAGGPGGDNGVIALPKKKDQPDEAPLPPAPAERQ